MTNWKMAVTDYEAMKSYELGQAVFDNRDGGYIKQWAARLPPHIINGLCFLAESLSNVTVKQASLEYRIGRLEIGKVRMREAINALLIELGEQPGQEGAEARASYHKNLLLYSRDQKREEHLWLVWKLIVENEDLIGS